MSRQSDILAAAVVGFIAGRRADANAPRQAPRAPVPSRGAGQPVPLPAASTDPADRYPTVARMRARYAKARASGGMPSFR